MFEHKRTGQKTERQRERQRERNSERNRERDREIGGKGITEECSEKKVIRRKIIDFFKIFEKKG